MGSSSYASFHGLSFFLVNKKVYALIRPTIGDRIMLFIETYEQIFSLFRVVRNKKL
jgi:hypothetical protein